jgi:predicted dehydrogenase
MTRFAVAGPGWIGRVHARAIRETEGAELVAVLGTNRERAEAFAAEQGAGRVHLLPADLAADPEVDAVVIATPNCFHHPLAMELLAAGKHLLIEKPMAMNAEEAGQIAKAAADAGCSLMVGHMWRFDREAQGLRALVESGALGRIVKSKSYGIHERWGPAGWFTDSRLAGGGALIDMGVHAIDTVRYLLGDPQPVSVYATISTHFGDYDVDDLGTLLIQWDDGSASVIESGWWNPHMDGPEASTQLFGTGGYGRLFPTAAYRIVDREKVEIPVATVSRSEHCDPHMYQGQIAAFVAALGEGRVPVPGVDHGMVIMRICDAAYQSARENRVVEL